MAVAVRVAGDSIRPGARTWARIWSVAVVPAGKAMIFQVLVEGENEPRVGGRARINANPVPSVSATEMSRAVPGPVFLTVKVSTRAERTVGFATWAVFVNVTAPSTGVTVKFALLFADSGSA